MTSQRPSVVLVTQEDPFYLPLFLDAFLSRAPSAGFEVAAVTILPAFKERLTETARRMLRFYGPVDFARLAARYLAAKARRDGIAKVAAAHGVPLLPAVSVNDDDYLRRLEAISPDAIVSAAAPEIFRKPLLTLPPIGCVNIHSGRLPQYRGMMPTFWQLLNGESHATVTVHEMVERIDAGRVLSTLEFELRARDSLDRVIRGTKIAGATLLADTLGDLVAGRAHPREIDPADGAYYSFPTPADVRRFRAMGHRML